MNRMGGSPMCFLPVEYANWICNSSEWKRWEFGEILLRLADERLLMEQDLIEKEEAVGLNLMLMFSTGEFTLPGQVVTLAGGVKYDDREQIEKTKLAISDLLKACDEFETRLELFSNNEIRLEHTNDLVVDEYVCIWEVIRQCFE